MSDHKEQQQETTTNHDNVMIEPTHPSPVKNLRRRNSFSNNDTSSTLNDSSNINNDSSHNVSASIPILQNTSVSRQSSSSRHEGMTNNSHNNVTDTQSILLKKQLRTVVDGKHNTSKQQQRTTTTPTNQYNNTNNHRTRQGPFTTRVDPRTVRNNIRVTETVTNRRPQLRTRTPPISSAHHHHQHQQQYPPPFKVSASPALHTFQEMQKRNKSPEERQKEIELHRRRHQLEHELEHMARMTSEGGHGYLADKATAVLRRGRGPSPREVAEQRRFHSKLQPPGSLPENIHREQVGADHHRRPRSSSSEKKNTTRNVYDRLYPKQLKEQEQFDDEYYQNDDSYYHHDDDGADYYEQSRSSNHQHQHQYHTEKFIRSSTSKLHQGVEEDDNGNNIYDDEELLEVQEELMELQNLLNEQQYKLKQRLQNRIQVLRTTASKPSTSSSKSTRNTGPRSGRATTPVLSSSPPTARHSQHQNQNQNQRNITRNTKTPPPSSRSRNDQQQQQHHPHPEISPFAKYKIHQPQTPGMPLQQQHQQSKSTFRDADQPSGSDYFPLGLVQQQHQHASMSGGGEKKRTNNISSRTPPPGSTSASKSRNHPNSLFFASPTSRQSPRFVTHTKHDYSNVQSRLHEPTASSVQKVNPNPIEKTSSAKQKLPRSSSSHGDGPVQKFHMHFRTTNPQQSQNHNSSSSFLHTNSTSTPPPAASTIRRTQSAHTRSSTSTKYDTNDSDKLFATASMFQRSNTFDRRNASTSKRTKSAGLSERAVQPPIFADHVADRVQKIWAERKPDDRHKTNSGSIKRKTGDTTRSSSNSSSSSLIDKSNRVGRDRRVNTPAPSIRFATSEEEQQHQIRQKEQEEDRKSRSQMFQSTRTTKNTSSSISDMIIPPQPHTPGFVSRHQNYNNNKTKPVKIANREHRGATSSSNRQDTSVMDVSSNNNNNNDNIDDQHHPQFIEPISKEVSPAPSSSSFRGSAIRSTTTTTRGPMNPDDPNFKKKYARNEKFFQTNTDEIQVFETKKKTVVSNLPISSLGKTREESQPQLPAELPRPATPPQPRRSKTKQMMMANKSNSSSMNNNSPITNRMNQNNNNTESYARLPLTNISPAPHPAVSRSATEVSNITVEEDDEHEEEYYDDDRTKIRKHHGTNDVVHVEELVASLSARRTRTAESIGGVVDNDDQNTDEDRQERNTIHQNNADEEDEDEDPTPSNCSPNPTDPVPHRQHQESAMNKGAEQQEKLQPRQDDKPAVKSNNDDDHDDDKSTSTSSTTHDEPSVDINDLLKSAANDVNGGAAPAPSLQDQDGPRKASPVPQQKSHSQKLQLQLQVQTQDQDQNKIVKIEQQQDDIVDEDIVELSAKDQMRKQEEEQQQQEYARDDDDDDKNTEDERNVEIEKAKRDQQHNQESDELQEVSLSAEVLGEQKKAEAEVQQTKNVTNGGVRDSSESAARKRDALTKRVLDYDDGVL